MFPQFAGNWVLDEATSTGRLTMATVPRRLTIATTAEAITVTKILQLPRPTPERAAFQYGTDTPLPEVYRLDGSETTIEDLYGQKALRFTLVADALVLTTKDQRRASGGGFTLVTDAHSVDGDVLTMHRQLSSVNAAGQIYVMQEPTNNFRHTFVYRRSQ
jgi:hypothetical protein